MKDNPSGMTLIVKTITRLTVGLIFVYGIYIVLEGHLGPGGGFAGGVIIALSFIHLILAYGRDSVLKRLSPQRNLMLTSIGAGAFLFLAAAGFLGRNYFDRYLSKSESYNLLSCGLIPAYDVVISLMVGMGLFVIFLALTSSPKVKGG